MMQQSDFSKNILVVDDIAVNLRLIQAMLNASGFQHIHLESDSTKVQDWIDTVDINLIILDLSMPQKDGLTLFREIKAQVGATLPPVIFLTAMHDEKWKEEALSLGAAAYITKPFDQSNFIELVGRLA